MPQVKQLKELNVAGPATREPEGTPGLDFFIQWHLTERCNLRCRHCYQGEAKRDELSLREIREGIEEVSAMLGDWAETYGIGFSPSFSITGGEPFLRRDLFEVMEEIRARDIGVHLLTNGTLIDREKARKLSRLGVSGVQVSVEGPEEVHDRIRGRGSFVRAFNGIRRLIDAGIRVTVNATLSALNADASLELARFAALEGVQRFGFSRLVPCGSGRGLIDSMLTADRLKAVYTGLLDSGVEGIEMVTGDPVAAQMDSAGSIGAGCTPLGGCAAGLSGLTILPDGTVNPCRRLPISIGNMRTDSLREIWATSGVLADLRDRGRYKGRCGTCHRWATCRGCRAVAYAFSQSRGEADYLAEDPQCFIQ